MRKLIFFSLLFFALTGVFNSCRKDAPLHVPGQSGYPLHIEKIILGRCAVSGCHNTESAEAASGLDLTTWELMFRGNRSGAVVIPYWSELSPVFLFTNVYHELGNMSTPTMPLGREPLSKDEVVQIKEWIAQGAPDANGFVKFSDNPNRKKYYITNQGCDLVAVIDRESELQMRYVKVGHSESAESPHRVLVSPDQQHWYVIFINSNVIQKYRTSDDSFVGEANIGSGSWNTFAITPDSKFAFVSDFATGIIAYVDLQQMSLIVKYQGYTLPHGTVIDNNSMLYVLDSPGSKLYKIDVSDPMSETSTTVNLAPGTVPHEILFSADMSKYFIAAQGRNEVQIYEKSNDGLVASVPTGIFPQELGFSASKNLLFVTCMEDTVSFPGKRGSVTVIDLNTNTVVKNIYTGFQPHGIYVDDDKGVVLVANRNVSLTGPAPHHSSLCAGKNGSLAIIDLNTLNVLYDRYQELSVDPYAIDARR